MIGALFKTTAYESCWERIPNYSLSHVDDMLTMAPQPVCLARASPVPAGCKHERQSDVKKEMWI